MQSFVGTLFLYYVSFNDCYFFHEVSNNNVGYAAYRRMAIQ